MLSTNPTLCFSFTLLLLITVGSFPANAITIGRYSYSGVCAQCWIIVNPPSYTPFGAFDSIEATFTNEFSTNVTGIVFVVVHNSIGQTVEISTATLPLGAGANGTSYAVIFGLVPGASYSGNIFVTEASGVAISLTTTLSFTA